MTPSLSDNLESLRRYSSCAIANAIESLQIRLRNEGFTNGSIRRMTSSGGAVAGHAATIKIKCSSPPTDSLNYIERTSWWDQILKVPAPRFLVIEDVDPFPGTGALVGEVHANILRALGCVAAATNGAVRDVPEVDELRFSLFAGSFSVSHAYSHIVEAGAPVQIGGLAVNPGDLLHADRHGIVSVPRDRIQEILNRAATERREEEELIAICKSRNFSIEALRGAIRRLRAMNS